MIVFELSAIIACLGVPGTAGVVPGAPGMSTLVAQGGSGLPRLSVSVDAVGNYTVAIGGAPWLESSPLSMYSGGVRHVAGHGLVMLGHRSYNGTDDKLGAFQALELSWSIANHSGGDEGDVDFVSTFKALHGGTHNGIIFEQAFPRGVTNFSSACSTKTAHAVSTEFPAFRMGQAQTHGGAGNAHGPNLSAWSGCGQGVCRGPWAPGAILSSGVAGGAPLMLWAGARGTPDGMRSVVLSPLTNLMAAGASFGPANRQDVGALGILGSVKTIPAGFVHQSVLTAGTRPTEALQQWGNVLLAKGGKQRTALPHPTDLSLNTLGYWTDNGAWYHYLCSECCAGEASQNLCPCPPECAPGVNAELNMKHVLADWKSRGIPARYLMLDSWWYQKDGDPAPSDAKHSNRSWPIRGGGGVIEWVPEPNVFPSGLTHGDPFGIPTFLHNRAFSLNNTYRRMPAFRDGTGTFACHEVCVPQSEKLFGFLMDTMRPYRPFVYEQDWISKVFQDGQVVSDTSTGSRWLGAMDAAARARNITVQFSMSYTPAIMESSTMQAVTQIRGSGDYTCGSDQWNIGQTSLLYWALGAVASKDTFWTTKNQPGCPKAGDYNCTEPNVELQLAVATLSWGPVGPGDRLGLTEAALALRSCDASGRLLRPDRPIAPLDLTFEADWAAAAGSDGKDTVLWGTHTDRSMELPDEAPAASAWHYLLATNLPSAGVKLYPGDMLLPGADGAAAGFVAVPVMRTGSVWPAVQVGAAANITDDDTPLHLTTPGLKPPAPPSPSSLVCTNTSGDAYCEHSGFYCDGSHRTQFYTGPESLRACEALCDADAACNCVSHADNPRQTGQNCRAFRSASKLSVSAGGYSAYVKPTRVSNTPALSPGEVPFALWMLAPRLRSGFALLGELEKAVPASRQRLCAVAADATSTAVTLCGSAGEAVKFAYVAPGTTRVASIRCTIGNDTRASVVCDSSSGRCSC